MLPHAPRYAKDKDVNSSVSQLTPYPTLLFPLRHFNPLSRWPSRRPRPHKFHPVSSSPLSPQLIKFQRLD